jgi:hypothetical protein
VERDTVKAGLHATDFPEGRLRVAGREALDGLHDWSVQAKALPPVGKGRDESHAEATALSNMPGHPVTAGD